MMVWVRARFRARVRVRVKLVPASKSCKSD